MPEPDTGPGEPEACMATANAPIKLQIFADYT